MKVENRGRRPFLQAAVAYLVYGILYEGFAAFSIATQGLAPGLTPRSAWIFLGLGAAIALGFPWLLYRGYRWFARILSILIAMRAIALGTILLDVHLPSYERDFFFLKQMSSPVVYALSLGVTVVTGWFVAVAGWKPGPEAPARPPLSPAS